MNVSRVLSPAPGLVSVKATNHYCSLLWSDRGQAAWSHGVSVSLFAKLGCGQLPPWVMGRMEGASTWRWPLDGGLKLPCPCGLG